MFRFKQFSVNDDRCAMKVGTDGVLLGAWADVQKADRVLDVGTGCGLVALMMAQRFPHVRITGIEKDASAAEQAGENVRQSPFGQQIQVVQGDFLSYAPFEPFDAVISNPPFFDEDLLPPDSARAHARHTSAGMSFESLIAHSADMLCEGGSLQVIIPKNAQTRFHALCNKQGLVLVRSLDVRTVQRKEPKRVLLHFVKSGQLGEMAVERGELVLMTEGMRSEAYASLCRDFYL